MKETLRTIIHEIPYIRDSPGGYVVGVVFFAVCYIYAPLSGDPQLLILPIILACTHVFYMLLGTMKYLLGFNKPKNLAIDLLTNVIYVWRRAR